jgi:hypothetical protein
MGWGSGHGPRAGRTSPHDSFQHPPGGDLRERFGDDGKRGQVLRCQLVKQAPMGAPTDP